MIDYWKFQPGNADILDAICDLQEQGNRDGYSDEQVAATIFAYFAELHERRPDLAWPVFDRRTLH